MVRSAFLLNKRHIIGLEPFHINISWSRSDNVKHPEKR